MYLIPNTTDDVEGLVSRRAQWGQNSKPDPKIPTPQVHASCEPLPECGQNAECDGRCSHEYVTSHGKRDSTDVTQIPHWLTELTKSVQLCPSNLISRSQTDQVTFPLVWKKPCGGQGHAWGGVGASRNCEGPQTTVNKTVGPHSTTAGNRHCQ